MVFCCKAHFEDFEIRQMSKYFADCTFGPSTIVSSLAILHYFALSGSRAASNLTVSIQ